MRRARYGSVVSARGDIQAVALAGAITDMYIVGRACYLVRRAFATRAPYYPGTTALDDPSACSNTELVKASPYGEQRCIAGVPGE